MGSEDRIIATRKWIDQSLNPVYSRIEGTRSSPTFYKMKSYAEKQIGQLSNGVFIAAMICEGFKSKMDGQNAVFNLTKKALNALDQA